MSPPRSKPPARYGAAVRVTHRTADDAVRYATVVYLVYLVPLTAIGVLVTDFLKTDEMIARIVAILAGVVPIAGVIYMLIEGGGEVFSYLGFGAYLTILAAIGMLLATFGIVKSPE